MRSKKRIQNLFASTIIAGLIAAAPMPTPAFAQEHTLKPQSDWALAKIDRAAQGGNSYCTLSRKYDDNIVLSLGRNLTEEYSLAIDFQQPVFDRDKSLKINLQPGPGQIRAYDMMPTSERAIVIRLGWDTGFFDTLAGSQQMKVKIADKTYDFSMPKIAKGQDDLTGCMEELKVSSKGGAPASAPSTDVLNADISSTQEFGAVKASDKVKIAANAVSNTAPAAGKVTAPVVEAPLAAALPTQAEIAAQKKDVAVKEKSILQEFADSIRGQEKPQKDVQDDRTHNFAKVASAEAPEKRPPTKITIHESANAGEHEKTPAPMPPIEDDVPAPVALKTKTAPAPIPVSAPVAMQASKADPQEIAVLDKKIEALEAEKKMLQERVRALGEKNKLQASPADTAKLEAKINELEIKNSQLEDTLRQSQTRIAETAINTETKSLKRIMELETRLEAATKDNATLAKQMDSQKLQQEDGRLSLVAGDWNLEQATKRYNEAEREIRRLGLQLEQQRSSCNHEKAQIEEMLFDPAVADQKQIEKLSQLEDELFKAQQQLANGGTVVSDKRAITDASAREKELLSEKAALDKKVVSLQQELASRDEGPAVQVQPLSSPAEDKKLAELQSAVSQAAQESQVLRDSNAALIKEMETLRAKSGLKKAEASNVYDAITPASGEAEKPAAAKKQAYDLGALKELLKMSGISPNGLRKDSSPVPGADNFAWSESSKVKGLATVKSVDGAKFETLVNDYIAFQKTNCTGDFASMPSPVKGAAAKPMALYEVACVGGKESQSSSLVFFEDKGRFVAIANQIAAAHMDVAMDSRDRIANAVKGL